MSPMDDMNEQITQSAEILLKSLGAHAVPRIAILLGSGLNVIADEFPCIFDISYAELPGFPLPTTKGHAGKVTAALVGERPVFFLQGRQHFYETDGSAGCMNPMKVMVRALKRLGVEYLLITNAAGSTHEDIPAGNLVAIKDHINLVQFDVLRGANDLKEDGSEWGPRFLDLAHLWDADLRAKLHDAAVTTRIALSEGVYCMFSGPSFETAAEVRMVKTLGADTVGMSVLPEATLAHHCGMKVAGCSAVTNLANGISAEQLSHAHTLEGAQKAKDSMKTLIERFVVSL